MQKEKLSTLALQPNAAILATMFKELDMDIDLHQNLYGLHLDAIYTVIKLSRKCVNFLKFLILEVIIQQPKGPSINDVGDIIYGWPQSVFRIRVLFSFSEKQRVIVTFLKTILPTVLRSFSHHYNKIITPSDISVHSKLKNTKKHASIPMLLVVGAHNCPNKVENRTFRDLEYSSIAFLVMAVKSLCSFVIILSQMYVLCEKKSRI